MFLFDFSHMHGKPENTSERNLSGRRSYFLLNTKFPELGENMVVSTCRKVRC